MYSALPISEDVKADVIQKSKAKGTTITSNDFKNIASESKPLQEHKQRIKQAEVSEDEAIEAAIKASKLEQEKMPQLSENRPNEANSDLKKQVSWYEVALPKNQEEYGQTVEGLHKAKLLAKKKAAELGNITSEGLLKEKAEIQQVPLNYKTDNDETKILQDDLLRKRGSQRNLN
jgi:hypothetical protein